MEKTIEKLKKEARDSWTGDIGEKRAMKFEAYLREKLVEYSTFLNVPQEDILKAWEERRNYSVLNYYQEANQPSLKAESTKVFETVEDFWNSVGAEKGKFRCPRCEGVSTDPYKCDSKIKIEGKECDWKSYGLFGTLGKGVYIFCKDKMQGDMIFMPVAWEI